MRRRDLILASLSLLAAPGFVAAQPARRVWRVGYLSIGSANPVNALLDQFVDAMKEVGYVEGRNLSIEKRFSAGQTVRLPALAEELVRLNVDIIVAVATPAAQAAKKATNRIPIVMAPAGDPLGTGLIASLARPGGNITGLSAMTAELAGKSLELFREIKPSASRVAVLANAIDPFTKSFLDQIQLAGRNLGIEIHPALVRGVDEYAAAFADWARLSVDAVVIQPSLLRQPAIDLALKHRIATFSPTQPFAEAGGLFSYVGSFREFARKAAQLVDRILKGANPGELPIEQPTNFELSINLKTAAALGLTIPQSLLLRAHVVIR